MYVVCFTSMCSVLDSTLLLVRVTAYNEVFPNTFQYALRQPEQIITPISAKRDASRPIKQGQPHDSSHNSLLETLGFGAERGKPSPRTKHILAIRGSAVDTTVNALAASHRSGLQNHATPIDCTRLVV